MAGCFHYRNFFDSDSEESDGQRFVRLCKIGDIEGVSETGESPSWFQGAVINLEPLAVVMIVVIAQS